MLFTQIEFLVFFFCVMAFLATVSNNTCRKAFLLGASYYFYAFWDYRFLSLIIISTLIDYSVGSALGKTQKQRTRNLLLATSLFGNLGILFFFKYFNFFITSFKAMLMPLNINVHSLDIILPIGISFYTFQTLSYSIDIYRKKLKPSTSFLDFAVFVAFFPQLVAGPIVRAAQFLPQLKSTPQLSRTTIWSGVRLFSIGLFKKVVVADRLAMFVDNVFANYSVYDSVTLWIAVLAYSIQIYCDFSGYSDMAIGIARIMGYELVENFNFPYLAGSIRDFWRRWHISLSSWFRDYLYIPLGGNRKSIPRTYINLMVTMVLCGLWHGAAWTFVAWGAFHGVSLALYRVWAFIGDRNSKIKLRLSPPVGTLLTLLTVILGWVLFRSQTIEQAISMIRNMVLFSDGVQWLDPFALSIIAAVFCFHLLAALNLKTFAFLTIPENTWYSPALVFSMLWMVIVFYPTDFQPFIYFQF